MRLARGPTLPSSAHDEFVAGQHYTENFDVVSADGTHTSVAIDILGTADGPAALGDNIITNLALGNAINIPEWALIANDTGSPIDVSGAGSATGGTVSHTPGTGANGTVTFTDAAPAGGTFTYTATDGTTVGAPGLVTVNQDIVGTLDGTAGDNILISSNGGATLVGERATMFSSAAVATTLTSSAWQTAKTSSRMPAAAATVFKS